MAVEAHGPDLVQVVALLAAPVPAHASAADHAPA